MAIYEKDGIISSETRSEAEYVDILNTEDLNKKIKELQKKRISHEYLDNSNKIVMYNKVKGNEYKLTDAEFTLKKGHFPLPDQYLKKIELKGTEKLLFLPDAYNKIEKYVKTFLDSKDFYTKNKVYYKLGMLMYGPPGNGKTSLIRYITNNVLPKDCIKIWCDDIPDLEFIQEFRKLDKLKVFIFEELTTSISGHSDIKSFLEFMDGESSVENSIVIATTNYPEELPGNVVDRKGRFDLIQKIGNPTKTDRAAILNHYFKESSEEMVDLTEDMTFADIKEIYLLNKLHGLDIESAVKDLKDHKELVNSIFSEKRKVGI